MSLRRLGASWARLGVLLGRLGGILRPLGGILGPLGRILVPLGPSWRPLGGVLGLKNPWEAPPVAGEQAPLLRIPQDFPWMLLCKSLVYPEEKDVWKDMRRKGR